MHLLEEIYTIQMILHFKFTDGGICVVYFILMHIFMIENK